MVSPFNGTNASSNKRRRSFPLIPVLASLIVGFLLGHATNKGTIGDGSRLLRRSQELFLPSTLSSTIAKDSSNENNTSGASRSGGAACQSTTNVVTSANTSNSVRIQEQQQERNFYDIAVKYGNDKASGPKALEHCHDSKEHILCPVKRQDAVNPNCRIVGHFYHNLYQQWLGPMSLDSIDPFLLLEIGFGLGKSVPVWNEFLPQAERHTIDVACQNLETALPLLKPKYENEIHQGTLHCGSSSDIDFLQSVYDKLVTNRSDDDKKPLKVVVEDASHIPSHMVTAVFFWLPRIEPGGLLFLEDIEPNSSTKHGGHGIQSDFLPQLISDIHYCGDPLNTEDPSCFPTIQPLIQSIHCSLHICVIQRNDVPASNPSREESMPPPNALDLKQCLVKQTTS